MSHETVLAAAIEHSGGAAMFSMVIVAVALIAAGVVTFLGLKVSKEKENAAILDGSDHGDISHRSEWASGAATAAPLVGSPLAAPVTAPTGDAWASAAPLSGSGLLRKDTPASAPVPPQAPRYAAPAPAAPPAAPAAPRRPGLPVAPPPAQQPDWLNGQG